MEGQVNRLAKFGSGKSMDLPNLDLESHAMSVTSIITLIIFQTAHNIFHISYYVVHIILTYAMRPWDHGLDCSTSKIRAQHMETQLWILHYQTQSLLHSFIHTSFFHYFIY